MAISKEEWQELESEFDGDLDAYIDEWSKTLEEKFAEPETEERGY
jgi:hypothetical protein